MMVSVYMVDQCNEIMQSCMYSILVIESKRRLSFSLLRSAIMCLRGSYSALYRPAGMLIIQLIP